MLKLHVRLHAVIIIIVTRNISFDNNRITTPIIGVVIYDSKHNFFRNEDFLETKFSFDNNQDNNNVGPNLTTPISISSADDGV